jgi:hypothetical protein
MEKVKPFEPSINQGVDQLEITEENLKKTD